MSKKILITLFFCFSLSELFPQVQLNENCTAAYSDIISLKMNDGRQKLSLEKSTNPDNLLVPYLENYIDFLIVFIGEKEEEFDYLEKNKQGRISLINKMDDTSRFKRYMLGNIHLQWAVARLKFKEYFTAAVEINKAYRLLKKNAEEFPDFVPNGISLGVLHIMIGMVPEKYQWLLDLISMKGSVEQGREELYHVLRMSRENDVYAYLHDETLFYLGFVELNLQNEPESTAQLLSELEKSSDDNLLLTYLQTNAMMRSGKNDDALATFQHIDTLPKDYLPFYFLDYLEAECHLRNLDMPMAEQKYREFLSNYEGRNYIKDARRKIAWAYLLNGNTKQYQDQIATVLEEGHEDVDIDKEAQREAESETIPNADLVKARLLFDGGYYQRADDVLDKMDKSLLDDEMKVERTYRIARVADESGNTTKAKDYYLSTIEQGSELERYYAGNSALKMGEIYEKEQNPTTAMFYYKLCLDLNFKEYENSIHSKANAAVERLTSED